MDATQRYALLAAGLFGLVLVAGTGGAPAQDGPRPRRPREAGPRAMDMAQTLSDGAQLHTLGFSALAFLTGSLGADSFFPPGKVADWWGFQYLRDNDPGQKGHNTDFLTRAANNLMFVLSPDQKQQLVTLAQSQLGSINQYAYDRFPLMKGFRRLLSGDLPAGAEGLSLTALARHSAGLYCLDGQISLQRAQVMGAILKALNREQRAYLDKLKGQGSTSWPEVPEQIDKRSLTHD